MAIVISNVCAVVPAAGFGRRMQIECPKQYLLIGNETVIEHTIKALLIHPRITRVVISISPKDVHFANLPLANHPQITVVNGGMKRVNSVLAGIKEIDDTDWVLVHDAVRPCLHQSDLARLLAISETSCIGGILATPVRGTIKRVKSDKAVITYTTNHINLWHALTPQFFPKKLLYNCLIRAINDGVSITDEASALEYCGFFPKIIKGRADNIKITYLEDLKFAEFYLNRFNH